MSSRVLCFVSRAQGENCPTAGDFPIRTDIVVIWRSAGLGSAPGGGRLRASSGHALTATIEQLVNSQTAYPVRSTALQLILDDDETIDLVDQ